MTGRWHWIPSRPGPSNDVGQADEDADTDLPPRPRHPQTLIILDERRAEVDEGMADVILECWEAGVDTEFSCENYNGTGWCWLVFADASDAERFLGIVAPSEDVGLWSSINGTTDVPPEWAFRCAPLYEEDGSYHLMVAVEFPRRDLEAVLDRLQLHNHPTNSGRPPQMRHRQVKAVD